MTSKPRHEELETALDDLPVGVLIQGPDAEIRYANRSALRLLGLTMDQLLGKTSFDPDWDVVRLDGAPFPGHEHPVPTAIRSRQAVTDVLMGVRRERLGERVWLLVTALPRLADDGAVFDVLCTFSDVTAERTHVEASERARELAERRMQEQADLLAATFRAMSEGVVLHGIDASIRMANRSAWTVLGLTEQQLMGRSPRDPLWGLVDGDGRAVPADEIPSEITRLTGAAVRRRVLGVAGPDQRRRWLSVTTDPVNPEASPPHHVVATLTDITELREAEIALQDSEARLARVIHAVPGVIFEGIQHLGGRFDLSFLSGQVGEVFGRSVEELQRRPVAWLGIFSTDQLRVLRDALRDGAREGQSVEVPARLRRGGSDVWIRLWARPEPIDGGVRWTGFVVDITEAHRLQERLQHSQRLEAMASLAAGVAHNFNNMLGTILPNLELALADAPPDLTGLLEDALAAGRSASELVRQLLFASRGDGERAVAPVRVDEVLTEAHKICRSTFAPRIRLDVAIASPPLHVRGSSSLLNQIVLDLLINARDAVADVEHPAIRLSAARTLDDSWIAIEVADNGVGMTPEVRARLGEPFFTTKPPGRGTGLGLASVFGIVSDLGGRIDVESEVGRGTTFRVRLPRVELEVPKAPPRAEGSGYVTGRRVLVIDDEPLVRRALRRMLARRELETVEAASGEEGLALLDDTIDVVLLDLSMPGLSGDQVLPLLKQRRPDVPVAVVTGHVDDIPALGLADTILRKPLAAETLLGWIGSVLP